MRAILVIDVPVLDDGRHLCNKCPIWNDEHCCCQYNFNMEAKGCPLKPMPQKEKPRDPDETWDEMMQRFGRNEMIDKIMGETE